MTEYKRVRIFSTDLEDHARKGWTVVPGTVCVYDGYNYIIMEKPYVKPASR